MNVKEDVLKEASGGQAGGTEPQCEEANVVISDLHMSEGAGKNVVRRPSWRRRAWQSVKQFFFGVEAHPRVDPRNPLEDFPDDKVFVDFVDRIREKYGRAGKLTLSLLGDTFDPLAVSWRGRNAEPPYEAIAVAKMKKIMAGHQAFFDALAFFIRQPNCFLDIYVGNHDLSLCWKRVQTRIARRIAGWDPALAAKIRFVDQSMGFRLKHRSVLYDHGMNAEAQNFVDPKKVIVTHRFGLKDGGFGLKLRHPILNMPYGSYMTVGLLNRIKLYYPLVGRLCNYRGLVRNAALHRWGWSGYVVLMAVWNYVWSLLFGIWHLRMKTSIANTARAIAESVTSVGVDAYARKLLRDNDDVKVVVLGHSHEWRRVSTDRGTYLNTGSWALMFELVDQKIELQWKRWRHLEIFWRSLVHFLMTGELKLARQLSKILGWIALVGAMLAFLFISFPKNSWRIWSYQAADFKLPIGILLVFVVVTGVIRLFSVKPRVISRRRLTFGLIEHFGDGSMNNDLMEYLPDDNGGSIRECV